MKQTKNILDYAQFCDLQLHGNCEINTGPYIIEPDKSKEKVRKTGEKTDFILHFYFKFLFLWHLTFLLLDAVPKQKEKETALSSVYMTEGNAHLPFANTPT